MIIACFYESAVNKCEDKFEHGFLHVYEHRVYDWNIMQANLTNKNNNEKNNTFLFKKYF